MAGRDLGGAYRWTARGVALVLVLLVGGLVARGLGASPPVLATTAHASGTANTSSAPLAPNGSFVTPTGATATIKSLEGEPTMVWFVADGCASCSVSIPAVAAHLGELRRDGVRVLTLGLYGSFPSGARGARKVVAFGRAVLGTSPERGHVHGRGVLSRAVAGLEEVLAERRPPCDPY
jgi:hypothetical protein